MLLIFYLLSLLLFATSLKIPLYNTTDPHTRTTYPIQIDFNASYTTYPDRTHLLPLQGLSLHMPLRPNYSSTVIRIGLAHPSDFLLAVGKHFKVELSELELTYHNQNQLQLLVSEVNLVEGRELFRSG